MVTKNTIYNFKGQAVVWEIATYLTVIKLPYSMYTGYIHVQTDTTHTTPTNQQDQ